MSTGLLGLLTLGAAQGQGFVPAPAAPFPTGFNPSDVVMSDVNADGHLDLITANNLGDDLTVLLGTGTAGFAAAPGSPISLGSGSGPQSVAVGDVNADGHTDLLAGTTTVGLVVLLGNSTGSFTPAPGSPVAIAPNVYVQDIALGDMNEDGHLDVITGNYSNIGADNVAILLGNGSGSFAHAPGSPFTNGINHISYSVAVADLNGDNHLDLVTANYSTHDVSVALGDGTAGFPFFGTTNYNTTGNGGFVQSVALGDANGDGRLDIVATNVNRDEVVLLLNSGTGTFGMAPNSPFFMGLNSSPAGAQLRDMNGDGRADLVIINGFARTAVVLLSNGRGNFLPAPGSPYLQGPNFPNSLALGDVDEDGRPDLAMPTNASNVRVLLNRLVPPLLVTALNPGRNALTAARTTPVGITFSRAVDAATVGNVRIFSSQYRGRRTATASASGSTLTLTPTVPAGGDARFRPGETLRVSVPATVQALDGGPALPQVYQFTTAAGGTGRGVFAVPADDTVPLGLVPNAVALADLDGDGDLDLLSANDVSFAGSDVSLRFNDGSGRFAEPAVAANGSVAVGSLARSLAVGDVDGDGDLDFVTGNEFSNDVSLRLNNGAGVFGLPPVPANGTVAVGTTPSSGPTGVTLGDIDGDGDLDLLCSLFRENSVSVRLNNGSGVFSPPVVVATGEVAVEDSPRGPALGDVDGDGDLDMLVANTNSNTVSVRLNNGAGAFAPPTAAANGTVAVDGGPWRVVLGDVDGDGDLDMVVPNPFDGRISLRLNNGAGVFAPPAVPANGTLAAGAAYSAALGDMDADGDLDLLWTNMANSVTMVLNNGSGVFSPPSVAAQGSVPVGRLAFDLAMGDVDGDGDLDFTSLSPTDNTASVRLNGAGPEINVQLAGVNYLTGSTYDFGSVAVGSTTAQQTFTIENLSLTNDLTISSYSATTSAGTTMPYAVGGGSPLIIAPGGSETFNVSLHPSAAGPQTGRLTFFSDDADEPSYGVNFVVNNVAAPTAFTWTGAVNTAWHLPGNWSTNVVPVATTTVTIPPVPNQPLVTTTTATCAALTVQPGASLSVAAPGYLTVNGQLYVQDAAGSLMLGRLLMSGGTLEVKGNFFIDGDFAATGGLVTLSGPTRQNIGGNGRLINFWNLTVGAPGAHQQSPVGIRRRLLLLGELHENGTGFTLYSDASGTAMVVNRGGVVVGQARMERHISGNNAGLGYRHYSLPVQAGPTVADLATPGFVPLVNPAYNTVGGSVTPFPTVYSFDEARLGAAGVPGPLGFDQGWVSPASLSEGLAIGRGYTVNLAGTRKVVLGGTLNNGVVPVPGSLSRRGSGPFAGYHLLGNPYPSPIAWDSLARPAGLDDAVYVYRSASQYTGAFDSYVNGVGTLASGEIAAMQGFFVHVSQNVPAFSFSNAARKTDYASPDFRRGAAEARPLLALALRPAGSSAADQAFVYFENGASAGYDTSYDAAKLPNTSGLNLASVLGADSYAINGLPLLTATKVLPLAVGVPAAGSYELQADQLLNFAAGSSVWLRDHQLSTRTRLAAGTRYAFTLTSTTAPGRFSLEFAPAGALAASPAQELAAQLRVWPNPARGQLSLGRPAQAAVATTASLCNSLGQEVRQLPLAAGQTETLVDLSGLAAGVYSLRVPLADGLLVTRRVVVE
jgi:hypothetical protein